MSIIRKAKVGSATDVESPSARRAESLSGRTAGPSDIMYFLIFAPLLGFLVVSGLIAAADYVLNGDPGVRIIQRTAGSSHFWVNAASDNGYANVVLFLPLQVAAPDQIPATPAERSSLPIKLASADSGLFAEAARKPDDQQKFA